MRMSPSLLEPRTEAFQCRGHLADNGKHNARFLAGQLIEELDFLPDEDSDGL
jgi:hypothetical protein